MALSKADTAAFTQAKISCPISFKFRGQFAANVLAGRYNPYGFIRTWEQMERSDWTIVDGMMKLPLFYWATDRTADPRNKLIAMHQLTQRWNTFFVRTDGSCNHNRGL